MTASLVRDTSDAPPSLLYIVKDITERHAHEEQLTRLAHYDSLTGLPNRRLFKEQLVDAMRRADQTGTRVALLLIDLDKFKEVNDSMGHEAGDELLCEAGRRLQSCLRHTATVARLGGDAFAVILNGAAEQRQTCQVANKILDKLTRPIRIREVEVRISASIGITLYPENGASGSRLLRQTDLAMYRAKDAGRNNVQFFTPTMKAELVERLRLKSELRHALARGELVLHYQPQIDIRTDAIKGAEALIRWQHPALGMVPPGKFIPLTEETGLITLIGSWAIRTACRQNRAWQDMGLQPIRVAVNVSARQLKQPDFAAVIQSALEETRLAPRYLELEITEGLLIENIDLARRILAQLRSMGVLVALDDFGAGYSSLSYLNNLALDIIKFDGAFVRRLDADAPARKNAGAIVQNIISLAHSLDMKVVAEGVETQEQLAVLAREGSDYAQGYLISVAAPPQKMVDMLRAGQAPGNGDPFKATRESARR